MVHLDAFPPTEPGQFVQLACADEPRADVEREKSWQIGPHSTGAELRQPVAMLRRPFSLAGRRDLPGGGVEMDFIHRVVGVGTHWLAELKAGDAVRLLGPLGNRFVLPRPGQTGLLIGGGVGIPPMLYLAEAIARSRGRAVFFAGALRRGLVPLELIGAQPNGDDVKPREIVGELRPLAVPAVITTDDGSYGFRGFVTQALEKYLTLHRHDPAFDPILYTCGPEPMMKRVAEIGAAFGVPVQIAVERAMACGMGTCQSCCIRVKKSDPELPPLAGKPWAYRLACTDGPVFRGDELLW